MKSENKSDTVERHIRGVVPGAGDSRRVAGSLLFLLVALVGSAMTARPVGQPLNFNHRLHISDVGAECTDCHRGARVGERATIPNIETCAECHEEPQTDSPDEASLVGYIQAGERIPWQKVYRMPDHVFFSHRRHTAIAGLECAVCHGEIAERTESISRPYWSPTMDNCMECHEDSGVSNDCIYCHI